MSIDLIKLREMSKKMIRTFINTLNLDGDYYSNLTETPIIFGNPAIVNDETKERAKGQYITPKSQEYYDLLKTENFDTTFQNEISNKGLVILNKTFNQESTPSSELYITLIHELLHSYRNILAFDYYRLEANEMSYSFNNGIFEQNTKSLSFQNSDASQDILKGNIDNSEETIKTYSKASSTDIKNSNTNPIKVKMDNQVKVDEALIEIMSRLSYYLYQKEARNKEIDIWDMIKKIQIDIKEEYERLVFLDSNNKVLNRDTIAAKDMYVMCDIILKHHDFELCNWILDPITYSYGDIHYDFFSNYTSEDQEFLDILYDDSWNVTKKINKNTKISSSDIKDISNTDTAIENFSWASDILSIIPNLKSQKKDDNER